MAAGFALGTLLHLLLLVLVGARPMQDGRLRDLRLSGREMLWHEDLSLAQDPLGVGFAA